MSKCKSWLMNWLKLQQKGGGVEPTGTISITQNGEHDVKQYAIANVNVSGPSLSDYFISETPYATNTSNMGLYYWIKRVPDDITLTDTLQYTLYMMKNLIEMPNWDTKNVTNTSFCLMGCTSLVTAKQWDLSNVTTTRSMFTECTALVNVPVFNMAKNNNVRNMFSYCQNLSYESIDNILQSVITMTEYTGTKTLAEMGITTTDYPTVNIQACPHYQDFVSAGWSIS